LFVLLRIGELETPSAMRTTLLAIVVTCLLVLRPGVAQPIISSTTYLGTGYDLSIGNPEGEDIFNGGLDPGLKPTTQILVVTPNNDERNGCPEEATCARLELQVAHTDLADDLLKYQEQLKRNWILEEDEALPSSAPLHGLFGSRVTEQVRDLVEKRGGVVLTVQDWELHAEASYNYRSNHKLNREFVIDVCNLPEEFNNETQSVFFNFLRTWGTHVIVQVRLGRKVIERSSYSQKEYLSFLLRQQSNSSAVTVSVDAKSRQKLVTSSSESTAPHIAEIARGLIASNLRGDLKSRREMGSRNAPVPLNSHLEELSTFVSSSYIDHSTAACARSESGLEKLRSSLEESMREYLKASSGGEALQPVVRKFEMSAAASTVWPTGSYAYLQPTTGCPAGFETGMRRHDLEDNSAGTAFSEGISRSLSGTFEQDVQLEFCVKSFPTPEEVEWNLGSYCVLKKGTCPAGFSTADAYLDDEDSDNRNKMEGVLPDGVFDRDTRYWFCCRSDAPASGSIYLPTAQPFVLFPEHSAKVCQDVEGMRSTVLWITFDTEGSGSNVSGGSSLPYFEKSEGNLKLFICYYEKQ